MRGVVFDGCCLGYVFLVYFKKDCDIFLDLS
jgi:hypothetical protein